MLAALVALDIAVGDSAVLTALYAAAPFAAAVLGSRRGTVLAAILAVVAALFSDAWNRDTEGAELGIQMAVIALGGLLATYAAQARLQAGRGLERLQILNEIATVAGTATTIEETMQAVESAVVPAVADFYMIDRVYRDQQGRFASERSTVAVHGPDAEPVRARLAARKTSVPRELLEGREPDGPPLEDTVRLITPVTDTTLRGLARGSEDLGFLRSLKMNSYLHVPLRSRGHHLGVITMAVAWSGRRYTDQDAEFARVLGGRIALALDNAGLFSDLASSKRTLDTAMAVLDEAVVIHERGGRLTFANAAAARLFGLNEPAEMIGVGEREISAWCRIYDEFGAPVPYAELATLRRIDELGSQAPIARVIFSADQREIWVRARMRTVAGDDGEPRYAVTALEDLTELKRRELGESLLARVGEVLAPATDFTATLERLAEVFVPRLADICVVELIETGGGRRRVSVAHRDGGEPDRALVGSDAALTLSLTVGGEQIGEVTMANESGRRDLTEADRKLAERLLVRAADLLERSRLAAERSEIAAVLQQGLIPSPLPEIPAWDVGALYRPAGIETEVGGDFYEAFRIKGGWMVVIGDVVGRGPRAASVTAQARYTLRTAGILSRDPRAALASLNRALLAREGTPLCTAVIVLLRDGSPRADVVVAGHPLPILTAPAGAGAAGGTRAATGTSAAAGSPIEVGAGGPVLGAFEEPGWPTTEVELGPGARLVLYTDGVTEAEHGGERYGEQRLRQALGQPGSPADLLGRLEGSLNTFCAGKLRDDVALLAIAPSTEVELRTDGPEIELIERLYEAFDRRSLEQLLGFCAPEFELQVPTARLAGRDSPYRGHAGLHLYSEDLHRTWDDLTVTARRIGMLGDRVVVEGRVFARSRSLGLRDLPVAWVWEVRDGMIHSGSAHTDLASAVSFAREDSG
ncbi:MAG TPA: SpoIIE family protein phosphatase [Solirubrobacterales bacterium]|nr:SpoIIE family protein phosphatase [Solirubrobacterales bacterium]